MERPAAQPNPAPPEVYAELSAHTPEDRVFEPSIITAALGVDPTRAGRAGDPRPWGGVRAHGWWSWQVLPKQVAHYADDVVAAALCALAGKEAAMAGLRGQHGVEFQLDLVVEVHVGWDEDGEPIERAPTLGLSRANVTRLAELALAYEVDLYMLS